MYKKVLFPCILFLLLAAAAGPEVVSAGVDSLASPTPQPTEWITAPVISGINPDAVLSEGNLGDSLPSGSIGPVGVAPPSGLGSPLYVTLKSQSAELDNVLVDHPQNVENVNCGPSSLSQALKILDPEGKSSLPTTNQLSDFMTARGLMYEWGTGVEELAYTAREFGYAGSIPFHNWEIEQLSEYLRQERPLIVPLGINGVDTPGHFVTLTGISEDGNWITFQDTSGEKSIISREKFLALWKLQGSAGLIPQQNLSTLTADPMLPWMGLFGAISAMALTLKQSGSLKESRAFSQLRKQLSNPLRKGIGAGPLPPKDLNVIKVPQYETEIMYRGMKKEEVEIPIFETKKVKVGIREIKRKVPQYETRRVQVGVELVTKRVPIYKIKKVQTGTKLVKKEIPVTRYRTKKVMVWKKYTRRVPVYKKIGSKRFVIGYKNETRWKRVLVTKKIPYQTTKTISIQVPQYKNIKVVSGYKNVTESVPKFVQKQVLVGHKNINETVPIFEDREVQVGTKIVTREMPDYDLVKVLSGYSDNPIHQESSLSPTEKKLKSICDHEKLQELLAGRDFEVSDVVYLKGGPGAGFGMEKVENTYSGYSGGGGPSTPLMLIIKLISRILVWVRDSTKILEGPNRKPDAQAIIMYSGDESQRFLEDIVVINHGNEIINVESIVLITDNADLSLESELNNIYLNPKNSNSESEITPGSFKVFTSNNLPMDGSKESNSLYIKISTPSKRSGFLTYVITK